MFALLLVPSSNYQTGEIMSVELLNGLHQWDTQQAEDLSGRFSQNLFLQGALVISTIPKESISIICQSFSIRHFYLYFISPSPGSKVVSKRS